MAMPTSLRYGSFATSDIDEAVNRLERERTLKKVGILGSLGLLVAILFGVAYFNFGQSFNPGPPQADSTPAVAHFGETEFASASR